ncbi:MAG: DeoR/GlpR family DNA-binding transcription regulator [Eubacteriales bacterium]|nr:DeoR/GlpR family DNA-binding transcription regulator [Eubacteriales bacterium]
MNKRQSEIVDIINSNKHVDTKDLKIKFPDISDMTIRRDLEALDEMGLIVRVHGGAKSLDAIIQSDEKYAKRAVSHLEEKNLIAKKALRYVNAGSTIFLDSGTSLYALSKILPDLPMLIFTGNLFAVVELSKLSKPTIEFLGGRFNSQSMCIDGERSFDYLKDININVAFLGSTSYDESSGFSCGEECGYKLKRKIMENASTTIILMDSSKIGFTSAYSFARLEEVDIVISDDNLPKNIAEKMRNKGVSVL